jgi:glycosyltransferase involved in cell wall biosynthesis
LVGVVIPARDAAATLERTLAALEDQTLAEPYEVVVVDDRSRDATAEVAERAGPRVRLVRGAGRGPAEARNLGTR